MTSNCPSCSDTIPTEAISINDTLPSNTQNAPPPGPWHLLRHTDLLPSPGAWANQTHPQTWAPSVHHLPATNRWVLYYSAAGEHCIGAAHATATTGPYHAQPTPFACRVGESGAIDAAGYREEADGTRWVVYKVDGSGKGEGTACGGGGRATPIRLQQVDARDGVTRARAAVEILEREGEVDGPLVEAPSLYAVAESIWGPYERKGQLIGRKTGDWG
ncbi:glycoside hydrolase family 43 protein [Trichocladium antarcticum]|uniref:Glycoside hydrolase family 43 protein n=1 Tax=Trichocladium antarcticum TaxID=1450529 RepID=A0AAN6ZEY3_9PEZI|nr:glycoside hydrolase family 43 protein [Trichocladium antarcticum]